MDICYVLPSIISGGGIKNIVDLGVQLSKRGHNVSYVLENRPSLLPHISDKSIAIHYPTINNKLAIFDPFFRFITHGVENTSAELLTKLSHKMQIDIKISWDSKIFDLIPKSDILLATYPTNFNLVQLSNQTTKKGYHIQMFEPLVFSNPYDKRNILEQYKVSKNKIVSSPWLQSIMFRVTKQLPYLGSWAIDNNFFNTKKVESKRLKNRFNSVEHTILAYDPHVRFKGIEDLIFALSLLKKRHPNFKFKLLLFGRRRRKFKNIPFSGEYILNPTDQELKYMYQNCDVFVTPSFFESFPLAPLQAMACGAKVITTRFGTEDFAVNEFNSIVVEPRKIEQLMDRIYEVLNNASKYDDLSKNAAKIPKKFLWEYASKHIESIYENILNG